MKKSIAVMLTGMLLLLSFITYASAEESILDRVTKAGVVRIGSNNDTPPGNFIDEGGNWVGFDVDLGNAMAEKLGVKVERVLVNNKTRISFLADGRIDLALANISQTRSREEQ